MNPEHANAPSHDAGFGTGATAAQGTVPRRATSGPAHASRLQQGLWTLDRLDGSGSSTAYTLTSVLRLRGPLDVGALSDAMTEIVGRHEVLRSVLRLVDGVLHQIVLPAQPVLLMRHECTAVAEHERVGELDELVAREADIAFDLAQGPLLRASLIRVSEQDHALVLNWHHTVFDGWSTGIFFDELSEFYRSRVEGAPCRLPDLAIQYADFAEWQRNAPVARALLAQTDYWRKELAGLPPLLALPTDRPRPVVSSSRGAKHSVRLTAMVSKHLRKLCRAERTTLFMGLLAIYQTLLGHVSGQSDVPVGSVFAGRRTSELQSLIGYFANTVVLRGRLSGTLTFRELLAGVRQTCLAAHEHQDIPFEHLVDELCPRRSLSHNPLFQVLFVLQGSAADELRLPGLDAELADVPGMTSKFDLSLVMCDYPSGIEGEFEYSTDLFDAETISVLAADFTALVEAVVSDADRSLRELTAALAPPRHRGELLQANGYPVDPVFVEQVLLAHPLVREAVVEPYRNTDGAVLLAAYAVGRDGPDALDTDLLRTHAAQQLADFLVPSAFVVLPRLPRTPLGEVDRGALPVPGPPAPVTSGQSGHGGQGVEIVEPWTDTERIVAGIWAELLAVDDIGRHEDFFELGGHSFAAVRLTDRIAEATGVAIAPTTVFQAPTVARLAVLVEEQRGSGGRSRLVPLSTGGSGRPLVLIHPIGGGLLCYGRLAALCGERPVYGLEACGIDAATTALDSVEDIAASHLASLAEHHGLDGAVLGGWSMGGVVAFEMARQRQRSGDAVQAVVMLDSYAPREVRVPIDDAGLVAWFADDWGRSTGTDLDLREPELRGLAPAQSVELLHQRAVAAGAADAATSVAVVERLVNVFRAHARAMHAYRPAPGATVPVILLSSQSADRISGLPGHGWPSCTTAEVRVTKVRGDHYGILREPHVRQIAAELADILGD